MDTEKIRSISQVDLFDAMRIYVDRNLGLKQAVDHLLQNLGITDIDKEERKAYEGLLQTCSVVSIRILQAEENDVTVLYQGRVVAVSDVTFEREVSPIEPLSNRADEYFSGPPVLKVTAVLPFSIDKLGFRLPSP